MVFVSLTSNSAPTGVVDIYAYDEDFNLLSAVPIGIGKISPSLGTFFNPYKYMVVSIGSFASLPDYFLPGTKDMVTDVFGTPFERVCDAELCNTSLIGWGGCTNVFGYNYDLLELPGIFSALTYYEQRMRYRMLFHSPTHKEESKVYTKSTGVVERVQARQYKIWKVDTDYIPSHAVEGLRFMMAHAYFAVLMQNGPQGNIVRRMVYDNLETKEDGARGYPTDYQRLSGTVSEAIFNKYRSFCSDCLSN
jgi:hypothetical protein